MKPLPFLPSLSAVAVLAAASLVFLKTSPTSIWGSVAAATIFFLWTVTSRKAVLAVLALAAVLTLAFRLPIHLTIPAFISSILLAACWAAVFSVALGKSLHSIAKEDIDTLH